MTFMYTSEVANERLAEKKQLIMDIQTARTYTYLDVSLDYTSNFTSSTTFTATTLPSMLTLIKNVQLIFNGTIVIYSLSGANAIETLSLNSPNGNSVYRQTFTKSTNDYSVRTTCRFRIPFILPILKGGAAMSSALYATSTSNISLEIDIGSIKDILGLSAATSTSLSGELSVTGNYSRTFTASSIKFFPVVRSQAKPLAVQSTPQTITYDLPADGILLAIANSVYCPADYALGSNLNHNDNTGSSRLYSASYNMMQAKMETVRSLYYGCYGAAIPRLQSYPHFYLYSLTNGGISDGWDIRTNYDVRVEKTYDKVTEKVSKSTPYMDENTYIMLIPR